MKPKREILFALTDGSTFYSNELMTWEAVIEDVDWAKEGYQAFEFLVSWDCAGKRHTTVGKDVTAEALTAAEHEVARAEHASRTVTRTTTVSNPARGSFAA